MVREGTNEVEVEVMGKGGRCAPSKRGAVS